MASPAGPVNSGQSPDAAAAQENGAVAGEGKGYDENTTITTMADLKEKAPDLYKSMLKSLMMNMINQMNRFRRNLKRSMKQG